MSVDLRIQRVINQETISHITSERLINAVGEILKNSYLLAGFNVPGDKDLAIITAKLASDLAESYGYLTLGEIELCFELGLKNIYGEYHGINMRSITRWLQSYKTSELRYNALKKKQQEDCQKALPAVSEDYKREHELNFLRNVYLQYKAGTPLDRLYPVRVYQKLQSLGYIHHSVTEKQNAIAHFANYKPRNLLYISEDTRNYIIKSKAMTWLLKQEFDKWITKQAG